MVLKQPLSHISNKEQMKWKSLLILSMCGLYIFNFFVNHEFLTLVLASLTLLVFLNSIVSARKFPRLFSIFMFLAGFIIIILKGGGLLTIANGILMNLPLLTLIILAPLISIPIKAGGYFQSIHYFLEKMASNARLMFASISAFLFCFGPILNLGSIRVLHEMISDLKLNPILLAKAYLVGFSTAILWSPYFASVALVLFYLDLAVSNYIFLGIGFAIIQLIIGNILFWLYLKKDEAEHKTVHLSPTIDHLNRVDSNERVNHSKKMGSLFLILIFLLGMIFGLEHLTKWPMMLLVSLISIVFPILWCTFMKIWPKAKHHYKEFTVNLGKTINNETVMFISAGIFAKSLIETNFTNSINHVLNGVASTSFLLFSILVIVVIVILSYVGIHPIVVVTVLIVQIDPAMIGTTAEVLTLLFMISWSMSAALSPINPLNLLLSSSLGKSGVIIGLKWNGLYMLSMFITGILFVYLIH